MFTFTPLRAVRMMIIAGVLGIGLLGNPMNAHHAGAWTISGCGGCVSASVAVSF